MIKPDNLEAREEAAKLYEAMVAADVAVNDAPAGLTTVEYAALDSAAERAEEAFDKHPLAAELVFEGGKAKRCALSKAPMLDSDEMELVLRSALGLPPREKEEETQMLPDLVGAK